MLCCIVYPAYIHPTYVNREKTDSFYCVYRTILYDIHIIYSRHLMYYIKLPMREFV